MNPHKLAHEFEEYGSTLIHLASLEPDRRKFPAIHRVVAQALHCRYQECLTAIYLVLEAEKLNPENKTVGLTRGQYTLKLLRDSYKKWNSKIAKVMNEPATWVQNLEKYDATGEERHEE
jgi:hypothetical protein